MRAAVRIHTLYESLVIATLTAAALTSAGGCDVADASANTNAPAIAKADTPGTLVVDAHHAMVDLTSPSKPYLAEGGRQIIVKANDFAFRDPKHLSRSPNVLRVLYNKSEYAVDWTDQREPCALNPTTLRVVKGKPFEGFASGQRAVIGVGFERRESDGQPPSFQEFWVASILFH